MLVEESDASPEVRAIYDEIKQYYGLDFVPNIFKASAHNPEALRTQWEGLKQTEQEWGKEQTYLIGLAVDITVGCDY